MTILFHGEGERDGVEYTWAISKGLFGAMTAVVAATRHKASVAAIVQREPASSADAARTCEALLPDLLGRIAKSE
jgi:hypothetical protein